jgi:hypothetical protein
MFLLTSMVFVVAKSQNISQKANLLASKTSLPYYSVLHPTSKTLLIFLDTKPFDVEFHKQNRKIAKQDTILQKKWLNDLLLANVGTTKIVISQHPLQISGITNSTKIIVSAFDVVLKDNIELYLVGNAPSLMPDRFKGDFENMVIQTKGNNVFETKQVSLDYEYDKGLENEEDMTGHALIEIKSENSISFPYNNYKTSLKKADWFFVYKRITMSMSEGAELNSSIFNSTHLKQNENLFFNGSNTIYNLENSTLTISGVVNYLYVMQTHIIPYNYDITIGKSGQMDTLKDAILELHINDDNTTAYHTLYNCSLLVESRTKFSGNGRHKYRNDANEDFNILFGNFELKEDKNGRETVYAKATITEKDKFMQQANVQFRGTVILCADKPNFDFEGEVKKLDNLNSEWLPYVTK